MKTNPKGFSSVIIIILILIALVVIGGGVYWAVTQQAGTNRNVNTGNMNTAVNQNVNTSANQNANENTNVATNQNINSATNQNANSSLNTNSDPTADWKTYRNEKYGFEVKYPREWKFGQTSSRALLADKQEYIDFYINGRNIKLPETGFKVNIFVDENIVPKDTLQSEALKLEEGRGALKLITEKYLTINGIPAYRAERQLKKGDPFLGNEAYSGVTRTDTEYTYLKDNDLYRIWFEIDNDNPDVMIKIFDQVGATFKFTVSDK